LLGRRRLGIRRLMTFSFWEISGFRESGISRERDFERAACAGEIAKKRLSEGAKERLGIVAACAGEIAKKRLSEGAKERLGIVNQLVLLPINETVYSFVLDYNIHFSNSFSRNRHASPREISLSLRLRMCGNPFFSVFKDFFLPNGDCLF